MYSFRHLLAALALVCLSVAAWAQDPVALADPPSRDQIKTWLHGSERDKAWAAAYILKTGDKSFAPDLIALAQQWTPVTSLMNRNISDVRRKELRDRADAMKMILDTTIQMRLDLPVKALHRLACDFPIQTFILLARKPWQEAEPVLLDIYHQRPPDPSFGTVSYRMPYAEGLLARHPPPGFAVEVYRMIQVFAGVTVSLPNDPPFGESGGVCAACLSYIPPKPQEGWPPIFQYEVTKSTPDCPGTTAIADDIEPRKACRFVEYPPHERCCGAAWPYTETFRIDLLAQMLGVPSTELGLETRKKLYLRIDDAEQFRQKISGFVDAEESKFAGIEQLIIQKGMATPTNFTNGTNRAHLYIELRDFRTKKDFPLPEIKFDNPSVSWNGQYWNRQ